MKFVVGENGRNPVKNLPRPRFVHHEIDMEEPRHELGTSAVGGERLTACATRPPLFLIIVIMIPATSTDSNSYPECELMGRKGEFYRVGLLL